MVDVKVLCDKKDPSTWLGYASEPEVTACAYYPWFIDEAAVRAVGPIMIYGKQASLLLMREGVRMIVGEPVDSLVRRIIDEKQKAARPGAARGGEAAGPAGPDV
ncbi:MAG: hypothetical protein IT442_04985 [Phycisphaeraceae bacterium]|nr:hypothetical protein [Phycisphaeraceae bacterium]